MPYINLKVAGELTLDQKKQIASEFSSTIENVTGKSKKSTYIVFEQISRDNWAVGQDLLSE